VTARRRRGLLLLSVALASGGLAASQVHERERRAAEELGPSVEVLVAARDLRAGTHVTRDEIAVRRMPARFAPPDALPSGGVAAAGLVGARLAAPVAAGSYLNARLFEGGDATGAEGATRPGERAVTVGVAGGSTLAGLAPGARVDVLVSTETGPAGGRTTMALAGAELLRLGVAADPGYAAADPGAEAAEAAGSGTGAEVPATLRVSLRQAVYLTAADNFAREIRLLARPPRDRSPAGAAVSQGQL
jgi:pilus assembly protein CpaB